MMKITIEYSNKIYNFEHGYETYIFCAAVNNEFDKTHPDELKDFIFLVGECYLKDSNQTPLGALSDYIAENWDKIKHLSRYDIDGCRLVRNNRDKSQKYRHNILCINSFAASRLCSPYFVGFQINDNDFLHPTTSSWERLQE